MPLVEKIKFKGDGVMISVDTGEALMVSAAVFAQYRLAVGTEIDAAAYRQLRDESDRYMCRRAALSYLAVRAHSAHEMESYLRRKGYSGDSIAETVRDLCERHYIDDLAFATEYAGARKRRGGVGRNLVTRELQRKGVSRDIIATAISRATSEDDEREAALACARKKLRQLAGKKNRASRLAFYLQGRGFDAAVIRAVLRELGPLDDEEDAGAAEE